MENFEEATSLPRLKGSGSAATNATRISRGLKEKKEEKEKEEGEEKQKLKSLAVINCGVQTQHHRLRKSGLTATSRSTKRALYIAAPRPQNGNIHRDSLAGLGWRLREQK